MLCPFLIGSGKRPYVCSVITNRDGKKSLCGHQRYCASRKEYIDEASMEDCVVRESAEEKIEK